jgi:hypothetical protein
MPFPRKADPVGETEGLESPEIMARLTDTGAEYVRQQDPAPAAACSSIAARRPKVDAAKLRSGAVFAPAQVV